VSKAAANSSARAEGDGLASNSMGSKPTESELKSVLESMGYELEMLMGLTFVRQAWRGFVVDGIDLAAAVVWTSNALLEAHSLHVRALLEFFYVGTGKWITAASYVPDWKSQHRPEQLKPWVSRQDPCMTTSTRNSVISIDRAAISEAGRRYRA
jgi:hypothetical protein